MIFRERIYSVLIVSSSDKFTDAVRSLLPEYGYSPVSCVKSIGSARRELTERAYDFVIINTPLPDDFGTKLAIDICTGSSSVALLFVKSELYNDVYGKSVDYGVMTLPKPVPSQIISQALQFMCSTRERLVRLERKTSSIEDKIEEIRLVNRAKWILIDELKMTESDAHSYIEKQAMDRCISKREIAKEIIKTYA